MCRRPCQPCCSRPLGIGTSEKQLSRIYDTLKLRLRSQTAIQVLKEPGKEPTSTSYMGAFHCGEDSKQSIVLFDYQPGRGQEHPQALGDYRGILMIDGYQAWRTLKGATHFGCMAHGRRKFVDALKARKRNPVGRRRRPSSSSTSSTGLKGRCGTKSRTTVKREITICVAFARNTAFRSFPPSSNGST